MLTYTMRRLALAVPTLLLISLIVFLLLELAPGDPMAQMPLTIPPEVREQMRIALGLGEPWYVRYVAWLHMVFVVEPSHMLAAATGVDLAAEGSRLLSWQSRAPVAEIIAQRLPQTLWVVGLSYLFGILVAVPLGVASARRPHSWLDTIGTFIAMAGFSVPTFFTGVLLIVIFSVTLGWLPSMYDTTLEVTDWDSLRRQAAQLAMPVTVLALYNAAQISRYVRAATLDNLAQDYVRAVRARGMSERAVLYLHVLRNAMIPVVTVIALGVPNIFAGAIITEQIFRVNGIGELLISAIHANDIPMVQTLTFLFAVLIVLFNLLADILYGMLDPRIRYD